MLCVKSLIQPTIYGLAKPDKLPIELISAIPAAAALPFAPLPSTASWPFLIASGLIHVVYFMLVALSYRHGELSFAYPIMRGSAPVVSAIAAALLLAESPSTGGWLGVTDKYWLAALIPASGLLAALRLREVLPRTLVLAISGISAALLASLAWPLLQQAELEPAWLPAALISAGLFASAVLLARRVEATGGSAQTDPGLGLWLGAAGLILVLMPLVFATVTQRRPAGAAVPQLASIACATASATLMPSTAAERMPPA